MLLKYKILLLVLTPLLFVAMYHVYIYDMFLYQIDSVRNSVMIPAIQEVKHVTNLRYLTVRSFDLLDDTIDRLELFGYNESMKENITKSVRELESLFEQRDGELQKLDDLFVMHDTAEVSMFDNIKALINESNSQFDAVMTDLLSLPLTRENIIKISGEEMSLVASSKNDLIEKIVEFTNIHYDKLDSANALIDTQEHENTNILYYSTIASSMILLLIVVFLNSYIISPIEKITKAIDDISRGNMDVDIEGKSRSDEIGMLARAFDRMMVSIKIAMGGPEAGKKERR